VDVFAELGLVGLFSMLIILGVALVFPLRTLKRLLKEKDEEMLTAFFGAYLSFVGLIAGGMTYATHMLNIFWFVCGLLFALYQYNRITVARERMG
jgi:O-antigen ligase